MMTLTRSTAQFAAQSNRQSPTVHDVLQTFAYLGMDTPPLIAYAQQTTADRTHRTPVRAARARHGPEAWADPTADFLPSDDEGKNRDDDEEPSVWKKLMSDIVPDHLPPQPPRHCWMFTPMYATQMLSELPMMQLVNRKLDNARLVEASLRRLIRETDKAALPELEPKSRADDAAMTIDAEPASISAEATEPKRTEKAEKTEPAAADAPPPAGTEVAQPADAPAGPDADTPAVASTPAQVSAPASDDVVPEPNEAHRESSAKMLDTKKPLLRAVNYKLSWYASLASNDSRLPSANLYTARLRGAVDEGGVAKRPRRYLV